MFLFILQDFSVGLTLGMEYRNVAVFGGIRDPLQVVGPFMIRRGGFVYYSSAWVKIELHSTREDHES